MKETITFGIALLGATLGVLNYWRAISRDRVRLRVSPRGYFNEEVSGLCIEVVNLGWVPVTVSKVSLEVGRNRGWYYFAPMPIGESVPKRLEPREAMTVYLPPDAGSDGGMKEVRCAFAETACGLKFRGNSGALKQWKAKFAQTTPK